MGRDTVCGGTCSIYRHVHMRFILSFILCFSIIDASVLQFGWFFSFPSSPLNHLPPLTRAR